MEIGFDGSFVSWRNEARKLLQNEVHPSSVIWISNTQDESLFNSEILSQEQSENRKTSKEPLKVSKTFLELAEQVSYHTDPKRWALMYRLAWRINFENRNLLHIAFDDDVSSFLGSQRDVRIDVHKTHAFVRFRRVERDGQEHYVAWHEPRHRTLQLSAPFFMNRFGNLQWSIFTSFESAHWDLESLTFARGVPFESISLSDNLEELWKTYYKSIFNPARIKLKTMKLHMPKHHWKSMPETVLISEMLSQSQQQLDDMFERQGTSARQYLPKEIETLNDLETSLPKCRGCSLFSRATQAVAGVGPMDAEVVIVGEQPGNEEDLAGSPFVGPAGKLLRNTLEKLGYSCSKIYFTNAVKHFKWKTDSTKKVKRLHARPTASEIGACKPWLDAELSLLRPQVLICLGASAAQSVLGRLVAVERERGYFQSSAFCEKTIVTYHPAALLRAIDEKDAEAKKALFTEDLSLALSVLQETDS